MTLTIPGITNPGTLACIARARKFNQYLGMVENALTGKCPFCNIDRNYNKVVYEDDSFYAWHCNPPEKHTRFHLLIAPKRHLTDSTELTDQETLLMMKHIPRRLMHQFGFKSRGILIRDGDATLSAGTIEHLHLHIMVPDGTGRVESPFYKGEEAELEGYLRATVFEKIRTSTALMDLTPEESELVKGRL